MRPTQRMQAVQTPIIPVVGELIRDNPGTISLGQGVVHYGPPLEAAARMNECLRDPDNHKYKLVQGIDPLLDAIAAKLASDNAIALDKPRDRIVVTAGGNMAFMNAVLAITDPGDEIILLSPYYFNHDMAIVMADCKTVAVATDSSYQPDLAAIEQAITPRTRAIVTVSPNNPTGAVYAPAALERINELCRERGLYHISDEAYEYFVYDDAKHVSVAALPDAADHTISLFSLSKAYGFAGWRIGYMVIPGHLLAPIKKIQDTILICPPVVTQYAALGAMTVGSRFYAEKIDALAQVRQMVLAELHAIGPHVTVPPADGAFYALIKIDTDIDAMTLTERLVRAFKVAVIPGTTFGINDGCYLRVAYGALDKAAVAEGIGRLGRGLRAMAGG